MSSLPNVKISLSKVKQKDTHLTPNPDWLADSVRDVRAVDIHSYRRSYRHSCRHSYRRSYRLS